MENTLKLKRTARYATAAALALGLSAAYAASDSTTPTSGSAPTNPSSGSSATTPSTSTPSTGTASTKTQSSDMTGKQKATAIGATSGAVAGAVVGGPVGAVIGAGVGGYVGHEGTDAKGHVPSSNATNANTMTGDGTVRRAQEALNAKGYSPGAIDGRLGPNTESAIRSFQEKNGIAATGTLDNATQSALGI